MIFSPKSIYTKLFFLFFIIGVLPLIFGSLYTYYNSREALLHAALTEQDLTINNGMRNIVTLFVESRVSIHLTAQNAAFVRYFEEVHAKDLYRQEQENALLRMTLHSPQLIESAGFADANGKVISAIFEGKPLSSGSIEMDISDRSFFREALKLQRESIYTGTPEFSSMSNKWIIPSVISILNRENMLYGILYVHIYLDSMTQLIRHIAHPDDIIFVIDEGGQIVAHNKKAIGKTLSMAFQAVDHPSYKSAIQRMMTGEGGSMSVFYKGRPYYITYKSVPGEMDNHNRWGIGIMTSTESIYRDISLKKYLLFILSVSTIIFAIAGIIGWRIAHPIQELTSSSIAMSKGDLSSRVRIDREDEIGQLANAFNEMAKSIQSSHEELIRLSTIDGLTGLYNHREFQKRLEEEVKRADRYNFPLSLLMIDIDNFKKFNDTYGHQAGDIVLNSIGAAILQEIRSSDFAARYGGEEMAIVLPETTSDEAFIFSDRLREIIEQLQITVVANESSCVTVSIGIASFPEDGTDRKGLIDAADKALYSAKEKGRNKAIPYSGVPRPDKGISINGDEA